MLRVRTAASAALRQRCSAPSRLCTTFASADAHETYLASQSTLPAGFKVGESRIEFRPEEAPHLPAAMTLTLVSLEEPTDRFGAVFTRNAFPGAPVIVGRRRLQDAAKIGAVLVNNKISNVCPATDGVADSEALCAAAAEVLGLPSGENVLPSSTGVIGWRLPVEQMREAIPRAVETLQGDSILPAAKGIMTTDLYPKVRSAPVGAGGQGRVVAIGKGAGMVEPNMATMLVYVLTDLDVPRARLQAALASAVDDSFNCISVDSDQSTSDTVAILSSGKVPVESEACLEDFERQLRKVCADLAMDIVRNGEGVRHVMRVTVTQAPSAALARGVGKAVVNSPLTKCAVAGNDPNVGRILGAVGSYVGNHGPEEGLDLSSCAIAMGGRRIFADGKMILDAEGEDFLVKYMQDAELYSSAPSVEEASSSPPDVSFVPPVKYPPHERVIEIEVAMGAGDAEAVVVGADLTHEYVAENASYRS